MPKFIDFTEFVERCRAWQLQNKDWELICDIEDSDKLYISFDELPKNEKLSWIETYKDEAEYAYKEFATAPCKVEYKFLNNKLELCEKFPVGNGMMVFKTEGRVFE